MCLCIHQILLPDVSLIIRSLYLIPELSVLTRCIALNTLDIDPTSINSRRKSTILLIICVHAWYTLEKSFIHFFYEHFSLSNTSLPRASSELPNYQTDDSLHYEDRKEV